MDIIGTLLLSTAGAKVTTQQVTKQAKWWKMLSERELERWWVQGGFIIVRWRKVRGTTGRSDILLIISWASTLFNKHNLSGTVLPAATYLLLMGVWKKCLSTTLHHSKKHWHQPPPTHFTLHIMKNISPHGEIFCWISDIFHHPCSPRPSVQQAAAVLPSCVILKASMFTAY